MADQKEVIRLQGLASEMRKKLINLMFNYEGLLHIGGDLSSTEILISLFHHGMNVNPKNIRMPTRDRFVLSKGHGAVAMYVAMSMRGFFDYNDIVRTYGQLDSAYGMHVCKIQLPGVECSSGSLGQGLALATGMALHAKQKKLGHRVFCLMGDFETCEGEIWEAALSAGSYQLGNLIGLVDRNRQMMGSFDGDHVTLEPYADKWRAFNWNAIEIDGHNMGQLIDALDNLPPISNKKPTIIICSTIKGKGVSFMEKNLGWHAGILCKEDAERALAEIEAACITEREGN